jgi:Na+/proline symporter
MMLAIAFESVIKLLAMLAVGVFAYLWLSNRTDAVVESVHTLFTGLPPVGFISQTLLSFLAIICLPRQFHVAVVECGDVRDVRRARWMFGGYLVLISGMVLPIATAGVTLFGTGGSVADDSMVLALPLGRNALALIAYVGGFSAATGMVVVSSIALATMVSNDLVMPVLLRRSGDHRRPPTSPRACCGSAAGDPAAGVDGLQLLPHQQQRQHPGLVRPDGVRSGGAVRAGLIGGLYWRGASRRGVEVGMLLGFATWLNTCCCRR